MPEPFQSAPPVKGATPEFGGYLRSKWFQSAPPVKGATGDIPRGALHHAFQSAPPVKGATLQTHQPQPTSHVSIRAPREGGDPNAVPLQLLDARFNPRPP